MNQNIVSGKNYFLIKKCCSWWERLELLSLMADHLVLLCLYKLEKHLSWFREGINLMSM